MKTRDILATFNRGIIDPLAMARIDVRRVSLSAETQTNWMPRTLGPMMLRPGLKYQGELTDDGAYVPFIFDIDDTAILELTPSLMRVWDEGDTLVTRASVSTTVANDTFDTDLASWTDADETGTTSEWLATGDNSQTGIMRLIGTGYASARRRQQVTVSVGDQNTAHALRIDVTRGPVVLRIGSTAGADDVFRQAVLRTGIHSIAFTPGGNFWIEFSNARTHYVQVDSCEIEAAGTLTLPTIWPDANTCRLVRSAQSSDVVFCACDGYRPQRIERRPNNSWSVVDYTPEDGPFLTENTEPIRLTPSGLTGFISVQSSQPLFTEDHIGSLWRLTSQGQLVSANLTAEATYTDSIRVTGVEEGRVFEITRAGTWSGTVTLQRSVGEEGSWVDVATYTANGVVDYDDGYDNSVIYYRIGFKAGDYTSGTAELTLTYASGSSTGVFKATAHVSDTQLNGIVLSALGGTDATEIWSEGNWSDAQSWPQAVAFWEGRLWWSGKGRNWASLSDGYSTFDPDTIGDSAPINRSTGESGSNRTNWLMPLRRLIVGTDKSENSVRSTSFDEPVTPSNYNVKESSTKGSYSTVPAISDGRGYFIGRSGEDVFEVEYDVEKYGYGARDLTILNPTLGEGGFTRMAIQQTPDRRLHCVRADGKVAVLIRDEAEDVMCWMLVETDGVVTDVTVLPGVVEDRVFYTVKRTIGGSDVYYHEEWAQEADCRGGTINKQADSFVSGTQVASTTISGLSHLEGETVVCWGDGVDLGSYTVTSGAITVSTAVENYCVGLGYTAQFKSAKLAGQTQLGLSLTQRTRINKIGLILRNTHYQGLQYGSSFTNLDSLPLVENGSSTADDTVWGDYDEDMIEFDGAWDTDNRICLQAAAPRPCTVLAAVMNVDRKDKD